MDRTVKTRRLFARHRRGDAAARDRLVEMHLPLARRLAGRYTATGESREDLDQVACLGLVKAIDRFEVQRGVRFETFAVPTILGELKRHLRDCTWAVHVPRSTQELGMRAERAATRLTTRLGRSPSIRELGDVVGVTGEELLDALEARSAYRTTSLDATIDAGDGDLYTRVETVRDEEGGYDHVELREVLEPAIRLLPVRERVLLRLRFENGLTQREIGVRLGMSQMHVSRLLRRALARIRPLVADETPSDQLSRAA